MDRKLDLNLREWQNAAQVGRRFVPTTYICPYCRGVSWEDRWPPNYGHASGGTDENGHWFFKSMVRVKCVCTACRVAFIVLHIKAPDLDSVSVEEVTDLVEQDGEWLTPHDVWRERWKTEHGEYPVEVYG